MPRIQLPDGRIAEIPADMAPEQLDAMLQELSAGTTAEAPVPPVDDSPSVMEAQHPHARVGRMVQRNLPTIAGGVAAALTPATAGASVAIPAALAGLGGAAGRTAQILLDRIQRKPTPTGIDAATDVALSGAGQAALTGGAGLIGKGAGNLGFRIYRGLLKPSQRIRDSFGGDEVVRTAIDEGARITRKGAEQLGRATAASRGEALKAVDAAQQAGAAGVPASEIIKEFGPVAKDLRQRVDIGQANELGRIGQRGKALVKTARQAGGTIPLSRSQVMKETAQDAASGAYRQMERGTVKQLSADDLLDAATARGLKTAVERRVPGVKAINANTQRLMGSTQAVNEAVERASNNNAIGAMKDLIAIGGGAGIGELTGNREAGLATGALLALLSHPGPGSLGAIGLDRLSRQQLDQWLRAAMLAVNQGQE